ncbi:gas vesicle protein GvpG [Streptomyces sp. KM273126]|uniref:gas vesicle protein GvpG n=1 Tax=Streptomyces sp. KM273126 TaxID=2545247 RepID=UPI0010405C30|nr:gas vesicle protein GvpG [Streptomyces sp. KM273126]
MGLISEVLLLPFAPVRGSLRVVRQVLDEAERQYYDPAAVRAELARLEQLLDAGEIDEDEFDRLEDELLDRLEIALNWRAVTGGGAVGGTGGGTGEGTGGGTTGEGTTG